MSRLPLSPITTMLLQMDVVANVYMRHNSGNDVINTTSVYSVYEATKDADIYHLST